MLHPILYGFIIVIFKEIFSNSSILIVNTIFYLFFYHLIVLILVDIYNM
jgi:hypothetical protein